MFDRGASKKDRKSGNCNYPNDIVFINLSNDKKMLYQRKNCHITLKGS